MTVNIGAILAGVTPPPAPHPAAAVAAQIIANLVDNWGWQLETTDPKHPILTYDGSPGDGFVLDNWDTLLLGPKPTTESLHPYP